jgi:hypothetical protein
VLPACLPDCAAKAAAG